MLRDFGPSGLSRSAVEKGKIHFIRMKYSLNAFANLKN